MVDGGDVMGIGSQDLAQDLGVPGQIEHPRIPAAMKEYGESLQVRSVRFGRGSNLTGLRLGSSGR